MDIVKAGVLKHLQAAATDVLTCGECPLVFSGVHKEKGCLTSGQVLGFRAGQPDIHNRVMGAK